MKIQLIIASMLLLIGCNPEKPAKQPENNDYSFFVGTYTDAESLGIYKYILLSDGTLDSLGLLAVTPNPTFLCKSSDNKYLLSVNELNTQDKTGYLSSYSIEEDSLIFINQTISGGGHPCFVSVDKSGFVLVANYTGGNMGLFKIDEHGSLSDLLDLQQHSGNNTRQNKAHAHSAWVDPGNGNIISVDLGTNELWISHLDTIQQKFILADPTTLMMEPGAGPRHLTFHPNNKWIYVVNELNSTVSLVKKTENNHYQLISSYTTLPESFSGDNTCADIHISSDGKFVYASNRGDNSIAIFSVNKENGSLTSIGHQPTLGNTPRNFSLSPDEKYLIVANQNSNNIVSFNRDPNTGMLQKNSEINAPAPVCILF